MALFTMTYGEMPTREQFDRAWDAQDIDKFSFGNDSLTRDELLDKLQWVWNEYADKLGGMGLGDDPEKQGSWLADVLSCLGIEWV